MGILTWALIVIAIVAIIVGVYAFIRSRQRAGEVFASQTVSNRGSS